MAQRVIKLKKQELVDQDKKIFSTDNINLKAFQHHEQKPQEIESDQFVNQLLDTLEDAVWIGYPRLNIYYANPAFQKVYGRTVSEFQADPDLWIKSVYPEDAQIAQDSNSEIMLHGHSESKYRIIRPDGKVIWIHAKKYLIKERGGNIIQVGGVARDITDDKEKDGTLKEFKENLRSLTLELSQAEEKEKRNISLELHDNVIQNLAFCKIKLKEIEKETSSSPAVISINEMLSETIRTIRNMIYELSPPVVHDLEFAQSVEWLAKNLIGKAGIKYHIYTDEELKPISLDMSTFLFKIVRELINNIIKHSKAKDVLIFLQNTQDNLMIIVQDDGIGFNAEEAMAKKPNSFGFFTIGERLSHIGGFFNVRSDPGKGTKANILVPLSLLNAKQPEKFKDTIFQG